MAEHEDMHDEEYAEHEDGNTQEDDSLEASSDSDNSESAQASTPDDEVTGSEAARNALRESMAADVAAFLARGGSIQQVDDNVMADPPRKPQTSYGSRPI